MRFKDPVFFLLVIPAAIFFILYIMGWISKEATLKFSSIDLVKKAGGKKLVFRRLIPASLRFAALVFLALSLMRPQTGTGEQKSTQHVVDMMIALDISGSMATLDFQPDNRLTAAKIEAKKFIQARPADRIGLVVFAGQSITQCPLTIDHQAITALLDQIQIGMVEDGTAMGLGLGNAVNRLRNSEAKSKVIILLTDGINNAGEIDPVTAADLAKQYKIKVYTVGVGKEGFAYMPIKDPRFGTRLLKVQTQIDEKLLTDISRRTGGKYFRAEDSRGLREIFREIDELEKTEVTIEKFMHFEEHYFWFLWPALILLMIEIMWSNLIVVKIP